MNVDWAGRTKYGKFAELLVVVDEEEDLVGADRSADADAELLAPLVRAIDAGGEERILSP